MKEQLTAIKNFTLKLSWLGMIIGLFGSFYYLIQSNNYEDNQINSKKTELLTSVKNTTATLENDFKLLLNWQKVNRSIREPGELNQNIKDWINNNPTNFNRVGFVLFSEDSIDHEVFLKKQDNGEFVLENNPSNSQEIDQGSHWAHSLTMPGSENKFQFTIPVINKKDTTGKFLIEYKYDPFTKIIGGETSYKYLVNNDNNLLFYNYRNLNNQFPINLKNLALKQRDNNSLLLFCDSIVATHSQVNPGVIAYTDSTLLGGEDWRIFAKIPSLNWTLVLIYNKNELNIDWHWFLKQKLMLIFSISVFLCTFLYLLIYRFSILQKLFVKVDRNSHIWIFSLSTTLILLISLPLMASVIFQVVPKESNHDSNNNSIQINDYRSALQYLRKQTESTVDMHNVLMSEEEINQLRLFVNSIDIVEANKVQLTGSITVKYPNNVDIQGVSQLSPFYFPDAVSQKITYLQTKKINVNHKISSKILNKEHVIATWNFSCIIHQELDFRLYPFDCVSFNLRIRHKENNTAFYIPDFDHYYHNYTVSTEESEITKERIKQSLRADMDILDWEILNAKFKLNETELKYSTNGNAPELIYQLKVRRLLFEPIISNFLPIFVISIFIFIILLQLRNLNMSSVITASIAVFFSLLLSHYKLRDQLDFHSVFFLEYFYFILYITLIVCIINKFIFLSSTKMAILDYRDNLVAKVTFWPNLLLVMMIFTMVYFSLNF